MKGSMTRFVLSTLLGVAVFYVSQESNALRLQGTTSAMPEILSGVNDGLKGLLKKDGDHTTPASSQPMSEDVAPVNSSKVDDDDADDKAEKNKEASEDEGKTDDAAVKSDEVQSEDATAVKSEEAVPKPEEPEKVEEPVSEEAIPPAAEKPPSDEAAEAKPVAEEKPVEDISIAKPIESIPPVTTVRPVKTVLPAYMLPSAVNVVSAAARNSEENPKLRASCKKVVEDVEASTLRNRDSADFAAFQTIVGILSDTNRTAEHASTHDELDKTVRSAIKLMEAAQKGEQASLDWNYIMALRTCAVDEEGHTVFMKIVQNGYLQSLLLKGSRSLTGAPIHRLRDTQNNNLVHLAVSSGNVAVVEMVLSLLGADRTVGALEQKNIDGKTPAELAKEKLAVDIYDVLKDRYSSIVEALRRGARLRAML